VITSFNGNKIVTTGGGGALMTDDAALARRAKHLSTTAKIDPIEFDHDVVGYNYRLSNVLAAIGVGQLELLDQYVRVKLEIAGRYDRAFSGTSQFEVAPQLDYVDSTRWMYTIRVKEGSSNLVRALNRHGIQARPVWVPLHRLSAFRDNCYRHSVQFSESFYETGLSLPCSVSLNETQQRRVIGFLHDWARKSDSQS
jgi:dTDP-4-amino-4,6-dideoxygalactose transaminase